MKRTLLTLATLFAVVISTKAQDSTSTPLTISGSADAYWKYDFAKRPNIGTSFATDQNSVSLGMIDIALKKTTGKASFVGEVSFGPRGQSQSIPDGSVTSVLDDNGDPIANFTSSFNIQNLYANYAFSEKFSMTAGYMATFVGYEVISPVGNYNYSTSYLFTNGPFQNAGIKATYAFTPKVSLMVGAFNSSWNLYQADPSFGVNTLGAQLMVAPVEGWSAYFNVLSGSQSGTILDLTTGYQVSESFKLGLNLADFSAPGTSTGGFTGGALYLQNAFTKGFGLGLRGEYFSSKQENNAGSTFSGVVPDESVLAFTLSANLKAGGLTFIPEIRLDNGSAAQFKKENGTPTKSATQASLALVYAF